MRSRSLMTERSKVKCGTQGAAEELHFVLRVKTLIPGQYSQLNPVATETLGPRGPSAADFVAETGKRLSSVTATPEPRLLKQRISLAVQGSAVCAKESLASGADFNEAFYI